MTFFECSCGIETLILSTRDNPPAPKCPECNIVMSQKAEEGSPDMKYKWTEPVEDVPDGKDMEQGLVYPLGTPPEAWAAVFLCPCGCKARVHLPLVKHEGDYWAAVACVGRPVTFTPSINSEHGCKSHYFITEGEVRFV